MILEFMDCTEVFSLSYFQIQLIFTTYATEHQAYAGTNVSVIYKNVFGQVFFFNL